jgi:DNA-binding CsgD family transcriptional regulator
LLIGYRLLILGSVVLVAALSDALQAGERWIVVAPIVASAIMIVVLLQHRHIPLLVLLELLAGIALVAASRGPESPFIAYLTVPVVHVALRGMGAEVALVLVGTIIGLVTATNLAGGIGQFDLAVVSESMLLVALPLLLRQVAIMTPTQIVAGVGGLPVTDEDLDLLERLAASPSQSAIADQLDVSIETVKVRVARLYRHIGARNRAEALAIRESLRRGRQEREEP